MEMTVVPNDRAHNRFPSRFVLAVVLMILTAFVACTSQDTTQNIAALTPTSAPPDPAIEPPPAIVEQPLQGAIAAIPEVWLVPSRQSKEELAAYLMTDVAQLDWVNPGLPAEVPPGTLVVIPPDALAGEYLDLPVEMELTAKADRHPAQHHSEPSEVEHP